VVFFLPAPDKDHGHKKRIEFCQRPKHPDDIELSMQGVTPWKVMAAGIF
jgi:hypothetical protein